MHWEEKGTFESCMNIRGFQVVIIRIVSDAPPAPRHPRVGAGPYRRHPAGQLHEIGLPRGRVQSGLAGCTRDPPFPFCRRGTLPLQTGCRRAQHRSSWWTIRIPDELCTGLPGNGSPIRWQGLLGPFSYRTGASRTLRGRFGVLADFTSALDLFSDRGVN